jgi:hypothetical protein
MVHRYVRYNDHGLTIWVSFMVNVCVCVGGGGGGGGGAFGSNDFVTNDAAIPNGWSL